MRQPKSYHYHDQTNLARWIKRLAIPYVLGFVFILAIDYYKIPHLHSILAMLANPEFDYLAAEDAFDEPVGLFYLLFFPFIAIWVVESILILRWIYRAAANTYALNIPIYYAPHWSVTSYIIPLANFVVPYRAMQQITQNSTQAARQNAFPNLLGYWWVTWLASRIISIISSRLEKQNDQIIQTAIENKQVINTYPSSRPKPSNNKSTPFIWTPQPTPCHSSASVSCFASSNAPTKPKTPSPPNKAA